MLIIDGHNLIPHVPGLALDQLDDEEKLIGLLMPYARTKRKKIIVFFDRAQIGQAGERTYGSIRAVFVRAGQTADDAIGQYVAGLGKSARNVTIVSSDRQVQVNARALHAGVISSEAFSMELLSRSHATKTSPPKSRKTKAPSEDVSARQNVDEWLEVFGIDPVQAEQPIDLSRPKPAGKMQRGKAGQRGTTERRLKKHRPNHGFPPKKPV